MNKVSVIIPCLNAVKTLGATLQSAISQDWRDLEIIVVDDGSTDGSAELVSRFARRDPRVRLETNPGCGVSSARNFGVAQSSGTYIAFLDADDLWRPSKTSQQVATLKSNPRIGVSYGVVSFADVHGVATGHHSTAGHQPLSSWNLLVENPVCTSSNIFISRLAWERTGEFNEEMSFAEDQEWLIRCCQITGLQVTPISEVVVDYRASLAGLSSDLVRMEKGWHRVAQLAGRRETSLLQRLDSARAVYLRYLSRRALRLGLGRKVAVDYLRRAFLADAVMLLRQPKRTIALIAGISVYLSLPEPISKPVLRCFGVMV